MAPPYQQPTANNQLLSCQQPTANNQLLSCQQPTANNQLPTAFLSTN
ncbi:hypothetical protein IQ269_10880 [Tychonema sp. LEGE 07199]|nr:MULTISPECIES: hypothetical protein [unclassified Tychonema]MBE9121289.1 hypothetical protein [Tychonema sp. LEGE 07199]MBE9130415.1 hypothetical protein [Tychonema sp. LEGE 07196]